MTSIYSVLLFIVGISIGSFLNVLVLRIDNLKSVWSDRSHCPACQHVLAWYDLVPLASFFLLRGKCRYCKTKISWQYPIVEFITGILFVLLFQRFGLSSALAFYLVIFSILMVVFVHDLRTQMVPEIFVWIALAITLVGSWYFGNMTFPQILWGGLIGGGFLGLLVLISKEKWMGAGDIKLGVILGLLVGYPVVIFGLFLAFTLGAVVGLVYIKLTGKTIKSSLPFAPFLIFSMAVSLIFGTAVIGWYFGNFLY